MLNTGHFRRTSRAYGRVRLRDNVRAVPRDELDVWVPSEPRLVHLPPKPISKTARGQGGTGTGSEIGEGATAVRERHPHLAGAGYSVENDEENAEIAHFLCLFDRRGTTVRKSLSCHVTSCHVTHHAKSYFLYSFSSIVE